MKKTSKFINKICLFAQINPKINLTAQEQFIFNVLLAANQEMNNGKTTLRVAGGWIRDRLLGKISDDIDIALDNVTGKQFENMLLQYGQNHPEARIGKSYTVDANVEKSKHLETTAVEINGIKIDFVNLRSEEYGNTRVPSMKMGTPQQDAERRDLTINALFYNINNGQIEDFVGGLKDLETMTLRTPLDPKKTCLDDPLRILRFLRFFSKYPNAKLDPKLLSTFYDKDVQMAYKNKVMPERAGKEIMKMMEYARPAESLDILLKSGLAEAIFNPEHPKLKEFQNIRDRENWFNFDQKNPNHDKTLDQHTIAVVQNINNQMKNMNVPSKIRGLMNWAAFMHDFGKAHNLGGQYVPDKGHWQYIGHQDYSEKMAASALDAFAVPEEDKSFIMNVIRHHMEPHGSSEWNDKTIRKFVQNKAKIFKTPEQIESYKQKLASEGNSPEQINEIIKWFTTDHWKLIMEHGRADEASEEDSKKLDSTINRINQQLQVMPPETPIIKPGEIIMTIQSINPKIKPNKPIGWVQELTDLVKDNQTKETTPEQAKQFIINQWNNPTSENGGKALKDKYAI